MRAISNAVSVNCTFNLKEDLSRKSKHIQGMHLLSLPAVLLKTKNDTDGVTADKETLDQ